MAVLGAWRYPLKALDTRGSHPIFMPRKRKKEENTFYLPENISSVEHLIFIGSWLDLKQKGKVSHSQSFYGIDLLSRKICPSDDMFFSILSDIFNFEFSKESSLCIKFIVPNSIIDELSSENFRFKTSSNKEELLKIWTQIACYETIEFINHLLSRIGSEPVKNCNANKIISRLLLHFSTGQLWNLAYKTNQKVCEHILTKRIKATDIPDRFLEIFVEKSLLYAENGWVPLPFKRWGFQCRQSNHSKYFFDEVLGISEKGFNVKPDISTIENI